MDIHAAFELYKQQSWHEAKDICQTILEQNPQDIDANHIGGVCHKNLKNFDQSRVLLETACKLAPENWEIWYNLALVYQDIKSWQDSISACEKGLLINPHAQKIHICRLINQVKLQQLDMWQQQWQQVLDLADVFGWDLVAHACEQQGWYQNGNENNDSSHGWGAFFGELPFQS